MPQEYIEITEKTLEEAITTACRKLSVTSDRLDYVVIQREKSGFLGIGAKPAIIKARAKVSAQTAQAILDDVLSKAEKRIQKENTVKDSMKEKALKVLENGNCLGLFPEGTRNKTEAFLLPFKYGAVSLAHKTNATLVPFAVTGDYVFHGDNLTYRFGKPFKAQDDLEKTNKYLYRQIGNLMRTSLKEEEKRKKAKKKQK